MNDYGLGNFLQTISVTRRLTAEEELHIFQEYQKTQNPDTRELILTSHFYLLRQIANIYIKANHNYDLIDLIHIGYFGLHKAFENFDIQKGVRFATYASYVIKDEIIRELNKTGRLIKTTEQEQYESALLLKTEQDFLKSQHRKPTTQELSQLLKIKSPKIDQLRKIAQLNKTHESLNLTRSSDSSDTIMDILPDTKTDNPEKKIVQEQIQKIIRQAIQNLSNPQLEQILYLRFFENLTHEEISKRTNIHIDMIYQLQAKGLHKLKKQLLKTHPDLIENI